MKGGRAEKRTNERMNKQKIKKSINADVGQLEQTADSQSGECRLRPHAKVFKLEKSKSGASQRAHTHSGCLISESAAAAAVAAALVALSASN